MDSQGSLRDSQGIPKEDFPGLDGAWPGIKEAFQPTPPHSGIKQPCAAKSNGCTIKNTTLEK